MCQRQIMVELSNKIKSPRSPWRRSIREPIKPRLSRRIVTNARVNLNSYWSKFEDLAKQDTSLVAHQLPASFTTYIDNEINENLVNELLELHGK